MGNGDLPKKLNGRVCVWVMAWNAVKCQHQKTCRVKGKSYRFGLGSTLISVLYLLQISPLFCSPSIHSRKFVRFWVRISKKGRKFTSKSWRSKRNEAKKKKTESLCFAALLGSHRVCYSLLPEFRPSPAGLHWESGRHLIEKKQPPSRHIHTHTHLIYVPCVRGVIRIHKVSRKAHIRIHTTMPLTSHFFSHTRKKVSFFHRTKWPVHISVMRAMIRWLAFGTNLSPSPPCFLFLFMKMSIGMHVCMHVWWAEGRQQRQKLEPPAFLNYQ